MTTIDEFEAFEFERRLIAERHVHPKDPAFNGIGCNLTTGGQGSAGRIVTGETCQRISVAKKGKTPNRSWTQDQRDAVSARMSRLHAGRILSDEHRQRLSESINDPERKSTMRATVSHAISLKYATDPAYAQRINETRVRGTSHPSSSFTDVDVWAMRDEWACVDTSIRGTTKTFCERWANRGGTTSDAVYAIIKGRTWKHLL